MGNTVLVFAETKNGQLRQVALEALTVARKIANGKTIAAAVFGSKAEQFVKRLGEYGADQVYVVKNPELDIYTTDGYSQALCQVIRETDSDIILLGHTALGRDLAPRVAARLGIGLISDAIAVEEAAGELLFTRPIYSGKAFEKKKIVSGQIMATIRPNNISAEKQEARGESLDFIAELSNLRTVVKEIVRKSSGGVDLTEAKIVVSGGRGMRSADGFALLRELADVLGGAVGASRGACDAEYCDYSLQIGQTGKVVTPDLYIAVGISGAIQHLAGMANSKVIVAINNDPEAPIFQVADYGIVGDLFEVVPLLTEEFRKILQPA
ncbi:electron transfer flavoprotein subunit alpha/FixB family protein [Brevibacillus marinus]|uniref:electron transfer flavoprotein subunit alpha/FixB family protein n=1 Tax=Brevibacillus marinus TaxID=2496837 RepID=UPI000F8168A1|nr:electron transfer flavoprotein subunit alpha/FixB family protein [Brevibacillus marinus]